jgi:hypothetical protein
MINEHYNKHTFNDAIVYVFAFLCNGIINNIKGCKHTKKPKKYTLQVENTNFLSTLKHKKKSLIFKNIQKNYMNVCRMVWICFFKQIRFCIPFFSTFTLLSKFTLLSHIAQSNVKVLIIIWLKNSYVLLLDFKELFWHFIYATISVWVHIENRVLNT